MNTAPKIELHKILAPVDFSHASGHGLRLAAAVARQFDAGLRLLYVIEPSPYPDWGYVHLTIEENKMRRLATEKLPQFSLETGIDPSLVRSAEIRAGEADLNIIKSAGREACDLIVMASHGKGALQHVLLGSTAERVVRHAPCPVLVVRDDPSEGVPARAQPFQVKRILLPTDFSEASMKSFAYATAFARRFGATIILVHVVPGTLPAEFSHIGVVIDEQRMIAAAEKRLPEVRKAELDADLPVETHILNGGPAYEITRAAKDLHCDLIAISTHGYTGFRRFWLGSVAERVVRHATCPVLVVREVERDFLAD